MLTANKRARLNPTPVRVPLGNPRGSRSLSGALCLSLSRREETTLSFASHYIIPDAMSSDLLTITITDRASLTQCPHRIVSHRFALLSNRMPRRCEQCFSPAAAPLRSPINCSNPNPNRKHYSFNSFNSHVVCRVGLLQSLCWRRRRRRKRPQSPPGNPNACHLLVMQKQSIVTSCAHVFITTALL